MILEMTRRPSVAFEEVEWTQSQLPDLWPGLQKEMRRELAFTWAQLIVHARERREAEIRDEYGRHR